MLSPPCAGSSGLASHPCSSDKTRCHWPSRGKSPSAGSTRWWLSRAVADHDDDDDGDGRPDRHSPRETWQALRDGIRRFWPAIRDGCPSRDLPTILACTKWDTTSPPGCTVSRSRRRFLSPFRFQLAGHDGRRDSSRAPDEPSRPVRCGGRPLAWLVIAFSSCSACRPSRRRASPGLDRAGIRRGRTASARGDWVAADADLDRVVFYRHPWRWGVVRRPADLAQPAAARPVDGGMAYALLPPGVAGADHVHHPAAGGLFGACSRG